MEIGNPPGYANSDEFIADSEDKIEVWIELDIYVQH
jgi:hypothetical protein